MASIGTCYNTSWVYYSIDGCVQSTATSATTATSSTSSSSSSSTASSSPAVSGGEIAGAVVGSVCGLGVIVAVSAYLLWFRPRQQDKKKTARQAALEHGPPGTAAPAYEAGAGAGAAAGGAKAARTLPSELSSPTETAELPSAVGVAAEVPGDKPAGVELSNESPPVELPGDHEYRSSDSIQSLR